MSLTDNSLRSYAFRRPNARLIAAAALGIGLLGAPQARAGVEYVTRIGDCQHKVDEIGDHKDLFIIADRDVRFEVWGFQMDATERVRVVVDSVPGNITAHIVRKRSGFDNVGRGCPFVGCVEVEVDTPPTFTSARQRSLFFRIGNTEHRLRMTVKPYPRFDVTWVSENVNCIVHDTVQPDQQDTRLVLNLPPGHRQDASTCHANLSARVHPQDMGELDVFKTFRYSVTGLPAFLTVTSRDTQPNAVPELSFTIDTARIRALTNPSSSTIRIASPNSNRTDTLRLAVVPNLANGFIAGASCNPSTLDIEGFSDCTLRLATADPAGQVITWRMDRATCFSGDPDPSPGPPESEPLTGGFSSYYAGQAFQHFRFPAGAANGVIRVRSATGSGCANLTGIRHVFEAWIGDNRPPGGAQVTAPISGPNYTKATITVIQPAGS